ncbi:AMP-binding protein [Kitasatospora atroaurantiaca]|uniref:Acyl-CoA synthetase (AMP-forming)/AMP-acid ligase II n=1 Tax=Kitasatospora atroaurantiaca TaxID=285545 RepID=A0A561EL42_9ACTN|nr:AMP-binding protein [Kitasatospora atroaurantiaca]TWE16340.1 acyl-CoA synthetase (AMP-forming)/AMP-acid ligase II [Kitasatospora atroaurantiaca]
MQTPLTVMDFLDRAELVYGDRVGLVDEPVQPADSWGEVTYRRMAQLARAQAAGLDRLGVGPGERVAVVSHNSARLMTSLYGVSGHSRVLVPVNFRLKAEEVAYIVEQSGASVLLVDPELDEALAGVPVKHRFVLGAESDAQLYDFDREPVRHRISESDTATINYTSGTTARPKGVQLTHRNIWLNAVLMGLHFGAGDRDVYLHTLPMFHANGWGLPFVLTGLGAQHVVLRKVDGAEILRRVERHGVTFLCGAPAVATAVLDAAADWDGPVPGRDRVRIIVAGAPPPTSVVQRIESELGWEFMQIYGLTETSPVVTVNRGRAEWDALPPAERAERLVQAGSPALGSQVRVDGQGEVLVRSNTVLEGYWKQPDETAAALKGGWFHTGDGGTLTDGYLAISDRKKDVIITGGENVSSIEVEDCLYGHPAVAEVAVIGVPDRKWGETVKALVVLKDGQSADEAALIAHCKQRLAGYKAPTSVEFRDSLPRTTTGKLQKFRLREPYWAGRAREVN